jgi:hypothetical protein
VDWIESLKSLAIEKWWMILIAIVSIYVVMKIAKSFLKWAIIIGIIVLFAMYGTHYKALIHDVKDKVWTIVEDRAFSAMKKDMDTATYALNKDGTFTVQTNQITISGKPTGQTVKLTYKGISFDVDRSDFINRYIQDVKQ